LAINAQDCLVYHLRDWENIMCITRFYIKIFIHDFRYIWYEPEVLSWGTCGELLSTTYSIYDLLGSFWKLLAISLVKLTIFVDLMQFAFWLTTSGIIIGSIVVFFLMYNYLRARKIFWSDETSNIGNFVTFWPVSPVILL